MTGPESDAGGAEAASTRRAWMYLFLAWAIAFVSTLSALFIGEVLGQAPCVLCWYQRIAMFPLAVILGLACFKNDWRVWLYALPLSVAGSLLALWHSLLYTGIIEEGITQCTQSGPSCTGSDMTLFGFIPLPLLSLGTFLAITVLLVFVRRKDNS